MTQQSFCRNLINLRKSKNLSTENCALIAGVSKEQYEKMELGFEKVTFEVLESLAKFYQVDIAYFMEEHEVQTVQPAIKTEKKVVKYPKGAKAFNILGIVFAVAMLIIYIAAPIIYDYGITLTFFDLFSGNALGVCTALFTLIYLVWSLVNEIIITSSTKIKFSIYGFIESIIGLCLLILAVAFNGNLLIKGADEAGFIIFICILAVDLIFAIVKIIQIINTRKNLKI